MSDAKYIINVKLIPLDMHTPVFFAEAIEALDIQKNEKYIDATYGEGGHAYEIVRQGGRLLGIDADVEQVKKSNKNIRVVHGNFAYIQEIAENEKFVPVSGILFDFGLSMRQIQDSGKGFSFEKPEDPLDMRLNNSGMTVAEYLQSVDQETLRYELMKYSEDMYSQYIANTIIKKRASKKIERVKDIIQIINSVVQKDMAIRKRSYARIFQAFRIIVNDEIENIKKGLQGALNITKPNGKIVVITFHSLEDRIVKSVAKNSSGLVHEAVMHVKKKRQLAQFERSATLRVLTVS